MPWQDIKIVLYPVISSRGDLVSATLTYVYKVDDVTISNPFSRIKQLNSPKKGCSLKATEFVGEEPLDITITKSEEWEDNNVHEL